MEDLVKVNETNNEIDLKRIKIKDIAHINDYLYLIFDNGQKILTDETNIFDVSEFGYVQNIFNMGDKLCAVVSNGWNPMLIDLNTKEILYDDKDSYSISKQDERTLHVIMKTNSGNTIYDIERKCYLPKPEDYEFENSLGNGLYVFCENNYDILFYDKKRCVINVDGFFVLNNIKGWIYLENGYLIVHKDKKLTIFELGNDSTTKSIKEIEKNDTILCSPEYYDGKIIIVLKDKIEVYKPNLELIKSIPVEGLSEVRDSERIGDVLKLCVPTTYNNEPNGKHIFVNVETGKRIEHLRIEGYPYWVQNSFVGYDELDMTGNDSLVMDFHFYDKDFNYITKERGTACCSADDENESLFIVYNEGKKKLVNTENGCSREVDYIEVRYHFSAPYGYGIHSDDETMDFFDRNLNVIIPNFEFKKYNLNFNLGGFSFFIVNRYVCITSDFVDGYGRYQYRKIICNDNGEIVLDSINCKCYPIGNYIQIMNDKESMFLNTLTGEIGEIGINAPVLENGLIDFERIASLNNCLTINSNLLMIEDGNGPKLKKILPDESRK